MGIFGSNYSKRPLRQQFSAITIYQDANKIFKRDYLMISLLIIDLTNAISYNMNIIS